METLAQPVQQFLQSGTGLVITMVGAIAALLKLLSAIGKGLDMHNDYFVEKRLKRLLALRAGSSHPQRLDQYLESSAETEAFRIATGIATSSKKMTYLLALAATGRWNRFQLVGLSKHVVLRPEDDEPAIVAGSLDRWSAMSSLVITLSCAIAGFLCIPVFSVLLGWLGLALGLTLFTAAMAIAPYLVRDYLYWKIAQRAMKYLARQPLPRLGQTEVEAP